MSVTFDEPNLVPCAGLLPAALLAQRIDLAGLVDQRVTLQRHGANSGTKALSVIGSILAGGDSIDDTALLRAGATGELFDATRAPSTIGSWLRAFKWFNVRQLDAVSRATSPTPPHTRCSASCSPSPDDWSTPPAGYTCDYRNDGPAPPRSTPH